jgi:hypothetical protein
VVMDPRVKTSPEALRQQFTLLSRLSSLLSDGSRALRQARSVQEQLEARKADAKGRAATAVRELDAELTRLLKGGPAQPGSAAAATLPAAIGNVLSLYASVGRADAAPTAAQAKAAEELAQAIPGLVERWQSLANTRVPAANRRLKGARLPLLDPDAPPSHEEEGLDRDEG